MGGDNGHQGGRRIVRLGSVIYGADAEISEWVRQRIPGFVFLPGAVALGVERRGKIVAGVVFERCNGHHVEASIAADPGSRWADKETLFRLFHYPFCQLGVEAITVLVAYSNIASLNLATKLGFAPIAIIPFAATGGVPLVVLQMRRNECRWIEHGQGKQNPGDA